VNYSYSIERAAAEILVSVSTREQRFLQDSFEQIAAAPFHAVDFEEIGMTGRRLLTRFFGLFRLRIGVMMQRRKSASPSFTVTDPCSGAE
jgi:hypothetical protein